MSSAILSNFAAQSAKKTLGIEPQPQAFGTLAQLILDQGFDVIEKPTPGRNKLVHADLEEQIKQAYELTNGANTPAFKRLIKGEHAKVAVISAAVVASVYAKHGGLGTEPAIMDLRDLALGLAQNGWMQDRSRVIASFIQSIDAFAPDHGLADLFSQEVFDAMFEYNMRAEKAGKDSLVYMRGIYAPDLKGEREIDFDRYLDLAHKHQDTNPHVALVLSGSKVLAKPLDDLQP